VNESINMNVVEELLHDLEDHSLITSEERDLLDALSNDIRKRPHSSSVSHSTKIPNVSPSVIVPETHSNPAENVKAAVQREVPAVVEMKSPLRFVEEVMLSDPELEKQIDRIEVIFVIFFCVDKVEKNSSKRIAFAGSSR
jgi:hypothetical protein